MEAPSFADAKGREDPGEDVVGCCGAGECVEGVEGVAEVHEEDFVRVPRVVGGAGGFQRGEGSLY